MGEFYVYVYLDPRKPGKFRYLEYEFEFEPFYVGKGTKSRMLRHLKGTGTNPLKVNKILKIQKVGQQPIIIKLEKNLTNEESIDLEKELIKSIGRIVTKTGPLTNFTEGGETFLGYRHQQEYIDLLNRPVIKYDFNGNFIEEYKSVKEAGERNDTHPQTISQICGGGIKIWKNKYIFLYKDQIFSERVRLKKEYSIKRIDYNGEETIYNSAAQASRENNISISKINQVCLGSRFQTGGYIWRFISHPNLKEIEKVIIKNYSKYLNMMNIELEDSRDGKIYKNILHAISTNKNLKVNNLFSLINKKIYRFNEYTRYKIIL